MKVFDYFLPTFFYNLAYNDAIVHFFKPLYCIMLRRSFLFALGSLGLGSAPLLAKSQPSDIDPAKRPFSEQLRILAQSTLADILKHPFITRMIDGTLPKDAYIMYVVQNIFYLQNYERALRNLASRLPQKAQETALIRWADDTAQTQQWMLQMYQDYTGKTFRASEHTRAPVNLHYQEHQMKTTYSSCPLVAWAALWPCFWLYYQIGLKVKEHNISAKNPYASWLESYTFPEYIHRLNRSRRILDDLAKIEKSQQHREFAMRAFLTSLEWRWYFFDIALPSIQWDKNH